MDRAGTGGALFRNLYRDFLKEAYELTGNQAVGKAHKAFVEVARSWADVIALFEESRGNWRTTACTCKQSERLKALAVQEKAAMQLLEKI
jgi:hypothetical protein